MSHKLISNLTVLCLIALCHIECSARQRPPTRPVAMAIFIRQHIDFDHRFFMDSANKYTRLPKVLGQRCSGETSNTLARMIA